MALILAFLVVVLDQGTKWLVATRMEEFAEHPVIHGFFSLQFVRNPGAAFGMLQNQRWLFILVSFLASCGIIWYSRRPEAKRGLLPWSLGLILGGAVGNMIDRALHAKVVDFFLFYWKSYFFPNFNVADIAINVGVGLFILHLLLTGENKHSEGV